MTALILAALVLVFGPALANPLLVGDELVLIGRAQALRAEGWAALLGWPHSPNRPLGTVWFAMLSDWFGLRPVPYHMIAFLLHAGVTLAVYRGGLGLGLRRGAAAGCALAFAVSATRAENVVWLGSSHGLMSAALLVLAGWLYTRPADRGLRLPLWAAPVLAGVTMWLYQWLPAAVVAAFAYDRWAGRSVRRMWPAYVLFVLGPAVWFAQVWWGLPAAARPGGLMAPPDVSSAAGWAAAVARNILAMLSFQIVPDVFGASGRTLRPVAVVASLWFIWRAWRQDAVGRVLVVLLGVAMATFLLRTLIEPRYLYVAAIPFWWLIGKSASGIQLRPRAGVVLVAAFLAVHAGAIWVSIKQNRLAGREVRRILSTLIRQFPAWPPHSEIVVAGLPVLVDRVGVPVPLFPHTLTEVLWVTYGDFTLRGWHAGREVVPPPVPGRPRRSLTFDGAVFR